MFDPVLLRTFVAVADTLSFTQAAHRLSLSQPTVSQHIRKLEQAAGRNLVNRDTRDVSLTDNGDVQLVRSRTRVVRLEIGEPEILLTGRIGVDGGWTDDAVTPEAADRVEERGERLLQGELHRLLVKRVDLLNLVEEKIHTQLELLHPIVAEFDRLSIDRATIVELRSWFELDGVNQPVF